MSMIMWTKMMMMLMIMMMMTMMRMIMLMMMYDWCAWAKQVDTAGKQV